MEVSARRILERMSDEPDIAAIAALIGDPKRARMLLVLAGGKALTATELAQTAELTRQTASAHLARLTQARLLAVEPQGRHRYFRLAGRNVARALESLLGLAARDAVATRTGPRDSALRSARVCYDHLAGETAVAVYASCERQQFFRHGERGMALSRRGAEFMRGFGIDLDALARSRRALCRSCLDWSERRHHLAGALGAALLARLFELDWARRTKHSRAVIFTAQGLTQLRREFELP